MADENDQALLDRVATGISSLEGMEKLADARPAQFRPAWAEAWARQQYDANPAIWPDYLQAAIRQPHLFQNGTASVMSHVEPVVSHFARDGLTRPDYFKAVAAEPQLVLQKPADVIRNLETVMDHYAADQLIRSDYVQAALQTAGSLPHATRGSRRHRRGSSGPLGSPRRHQPRPSLPGRRTDANIHPGPACNPATDDPR
jgi:hypothetical protein